MSKFCKQGHNLDVVGRASDGRCKPCRQAYLKSEKYQKLHKVTVTKWRIDNKDYKNRQVKEWGFKKKFGIDLNDYEVMVKNQNGLCAVCGKSQDNCNRKLAVDHDHSTGKIRALLCTNCNLILGLAHDDTEVLKKLITYLENSNRILN